MATVELVRGEVEAAGAVLRRPVPGSGVSAPAGSAGRARALLLLLLFLVACALAAVGVALAAVAVWQEVYAWVLPKVVGDTLTG